ncbi:hypothetical protein EXIGLDRAFT_490392 [Exidia glandulosa HHB12029]|uniref:Uncharacterized protein n=1 Tax=Exidia glandulosa HHB12029 TaxID=1314781 RepID=A0A165JN31_EXIGL|nr:hypothetical protein EXIGLDRAFT_490392 [Exidia glandulosa HHB12029]
MPHRAASSLSGRGGCVNEGPEDAHLARPPVVLNIPTPSLHPTLSSSVPPSPVLSPSRTPSLSRTPAPHAPSHRILPCTPLYVFRPVLTRPVTLLHPSSPRAP